MVKMISWFLCVLLGIMLTVSVSYSSDSTIGELTELVPKAFSSQVTNDDEMKVLIKENQRCIRCHQKKRLIKGINAITSVGGHESAEFYNNCTACHRSKKSHPKENNLVTIVPFDTNSEMSIFEQNKQCIACHSPEHLRNIEWTHDPHAAKLICSACHSLHKESDPILGISTTFRIALCATCHEAIQREKKEKRNNKERVHEYN